MKKGSIDVDALYDKYQAAEKLIQKILPPCWIQNCEIAPTYNYTIDNNTIAYYCSEHNSEIAVRLPYADDVVAWVDAGGRFF